MAFKAIFRVSAVFGVLAVLALPVRADPPEGYPFLDYDRGLAQARASGKRVFLYFGRYGCGWCDKTNKEAFSESAVRERYVDHYVLVYVDAESGKRLVLPSGERITEMELGVRMKVVATPVFAFLEPDGGLIFKIAGVQSAQDFLHYDRYVHDGIYKTRGIREYLSELP
ncbi:MAG TPA: thioredoxin fold domain-containing protein [Acidiferrobacterales bacterium]|jgi:thioredoxin-related protein